MKAEPPAAPYVATRRGCAGTFGQQMNIMNEPRTIVTFKSDAFNTSQEKPKFINPGNFGDDVTEWLANELERRGAVIDRDEDFPGQEDFGWYLDLSLKDKPYTIVVGRRPGEADDFEWVAWIERQCGFFGSITGGRNKGIGTEAPQILHQILSTSGNVSSIRWHLKTDFDKGKEDSASEKP